LLIAGLALGCSNEEAPQNTISYLALGDSYTIGEGVAQNERWTEQLIDTLEQMGFTTLPPKTIAKTGWRTDQLKDSIARDIQIGRNYDLVSLLIGVNNLVQGQSVNDFALEFEDLLQTAINLAKGDANRVFVLSIPDYGRTPLGNTLAERQLVRR